MFGTKEKKTRFCLSINTINYLKNVLYIIYVFLGAFCYQDNVDATLQMLHPKYNRWCTLIDATE